MVDKYKMDNKKIGFLLIFVAILFGIILFIFKIYIDQLNESLMALSSGGCFLESGKCVHERNLLPFIAGTITVLITLGFGIYMIISSKASKSFETAQKSILKKISTAKNKELKGERFKILLEGLGEDEKKVITSVKEQDGISQSTLRYRTDLSKSKLSMVLSQLEKKSLITKVKKGKINNIFLKKAL